MKLTFLAPQSIFFVFTLGFLLSSIWLFPRIIIPFGIAFILSLILRPFINTIFIKNYKKKILAVSILITGAVLLAYPVIQVFKTIINESKRMDYYLPRLEEYLRTKYQLIETKLYEKFSYELTFNPIDQMISFSEESTKIVVSYIPKILTSTLELSILVPLFLYFIIKDERKFRVKFLTIVPNSLVERFYYLYYQFNTKFGDYIFAKFIEASIVGAIITVGLIVIGFPFPFLLGIAAALTNILPYIGPVLGFIPALVIGLVDPRLQDIFSPMIFLYLVANIIDLAFVFPILVSKIVNLHPVIVVVSVMIGSQFAGVAGMIISIPLAAFLQMLIQEVYYEVYPRN